ncbi:maltose alpha-D-glucosyltransferase [Arsenicibacter rosenii]|uniref:Maltokinase n=1 Tax=Arsenicibacter rosenii TaxID=1750698 RepID=A0A1S2VQ55_9BACT|nr:maltose alpha-D-glucosyltransferase [Arsenicibacter rosenii]OIN60316.1 maltose alpha-D-glucosyltransferase [Arsenicibacter rosenii]
MHPQNITLDDKLHWYKDAIIYELHIKAFSDGNGDGIGDFQGLIQKLDYLQELGVTTVWVLPFYPSPLRDDGYDIADYYSINPSYGDLDQFRQFLDEAHKRNLKVITELVINHTSDQHPWFQRARKAPKGSPERDYYVWTDDPTQYKDVRIIFQDFEASNWTWDPVAGQYYWHRFFHHQPDLNYDSPLVQAEIFTIIDYWCEMGVDGFRLDAIPYLFEREGTNGENLPETHEYLKKLRKHVDEKYPGTVFLAEANMWPEESASYFGNGDECHMNYHFPVMPRMFMAVQMEDRYPITDIFDQTPAIPETCQWAIFLRNHDELTLEMVTDEERDYMYKTYAKNPKARINLGIRHRLAPLMDNDRRKIELLNSLLFSLRGTPVIYYGDEIGMGDNFYLGDRDGVRTPMQWSPDRNAGFSATNPQKLYLPVILDPAYHYESVNVETQRQNTSSLLWFTKRMINMRKRFKAFGRGDLTFLPVENPKILAYTRQYEDETILIVVNLSKYSQPAEIDLSRFAGYRPVEVFSKNRFPEVRDGVPYFFTMAPYEYEWFVLEPVNTAIRQSDEWPSLTLNRWEDLLSSFGSDLEQTLLPAYFARMNWFSGRDRSLHSLSISRQATVQTGDGSVVFLLVEATYKSGLPETYFLPLGFGAGKLAETCPDSVIARLRIGDTEGVLCDALFTSELQQTLLTHMAQNQRIGASAGSRLLFQGKEALANRCSDEQLKVKVHTSVDGYTGLAYDNCYFLKLYRKVDPAINPDLEITRYLTDEAHYAHIPAYRGAIEWQQDKDTIVLGMMQDLIENHGDGRTFMQERINNYIERILARNRADLPTKLAGTLANPLAFDDLPEDLKVLLGNTAAEEARLMGVRTAQLHMALADSQLPDFRPESFSLHYQRSLFAGMQSLVREGYQQIERHLHSLPESARKEVDNIVGHKEAVLDVLKRIYTHKLEATKIRIHGNYHLGQILLTGKDLAIEDFVGDPTRSYSERRLKRSPLRDVASMIRSFYYIAYEGIQATRQVQEADITGLLPFARLWAKGMSGFFLRAYLDTVAGCSFIPADEADRTMMLETYLLERALADLNRELTDRPEFVTVPARIIHRLVVER